MFTPLPSPVEMTHWDRAAIALGLPEALLMENASREAFHVLLYTYARASVLDALSPDVRAFIRGKRVLLFMGGGNNGGDAACLARHLHDAGAEVLVLHTRPLSACKGTAGKHVRLARRCGVPFASASDWPDRYRGTPWVPSSQGSSDSSGAAFFSVGGPDILVDGLLGTGFSGTLRPLESRLIEQINAFPSGPHGTCIFALDMPSGLNGLSGRPCPLAVRAQATVTFEAAKPGLMLPEAAPFVGHLHVRPIGIPRIVRERYPASYRCIDRNLAELFPVPSPLWHKGTAGNVLIIGGSSGLTGAPHLAARAALRSGAGLVSIAAPSGICADVKASCPDIMTRPLGTTSDWSAELLPDLLPALDRCNAVVIGPGIGRSPGAIAFVRAFLSLTSRPCTVIDADALHALDASVLRGLAPSDILTPHPGEAAGVLERVEKVEKIGEGEGHPSEEGLPFPLPEPHPHPSQDVPVEGVLEQQVFLSNEDEEKGSRVQQDRFGALERLKKASPAVWILKGAGTLVGSPGQPVSLSPYAVPNLAVGGSGDVLAGCLGTLLAQSARNRTSTLDSHLIACLGVLLHAEAGRLLARAFPQRGNTATDIAEILPEARARLARSTETNTTEIPDND